MNELSIRERRVDGVVVLDLLGNIRLGEGGIKLRKTLKLHLDQEDKNVILNLEGVTYVDSSGLGELVAGHSSFKKHGGELKMVNLTSRVRELMVITKLLSVFNVYRTEGLAIASFQPFFKMAAVA